jgi:hypothetical protein
MFFSFTKYIYEDGKWPVIKKRGPRFPGLTIENKTHNNLVQIFSTVIFLQWQLNLLQKQIELLCLITFEGIYCPITNI